MKEFELKYGCNPNQKPAKIYMADDIANFLKEPGQSCYEPVITLLGEDILDEDKRIDKAKMAEKIFAKNDLK